MITWGISANSHDAALAVFNKNDLQFASHSERYSGIKNDPDLNKKIIDDALEYGEPDEIVWYENPYKKSLRQLYAGQGLTWNENNIKKYLQGYGLSSPIKYSSHHGSHAAAGYYTSGLMDASIICIDSIGEFETLTIWQGIGQNIIKLFSQRYPHSLGLWYSAMTQRIGLKPNEDEYILMGMAAYGDPMRLFTDILDDFFETQGVSSPKIKFKQNLHRGCKSWRQDLQSEQDLFDIAAGTQAVYEYIFKNILEWTRLNISSKNVVLMGGCALNCVANRWAEEIFDKVWIMPNPGDAGSAVGSVLYKRRQHIEWPGAYLGHNIVKCYPITEAIQTLERNRIVGVACGKAEFGPRALGNRSLFADPRGVDIKDTVNKIKRRQEFRPFAPVILAESVHEYFDVPKGWQSPYMQLTAKCKYPEAYPAIVHTDNTSRIQTVTEQDHPGLYSLLKQWGTKTGVPMLLNTSLNIKGKPIVNDEKDAKDFEQYYGVKVV